MTPVPPPPTVCSRPNLRILYVDDLQELRELLRVSMQRAGHTIECCSDGEQALARLAETASFDLLITDHHMPTMNGLMLVQHLRARTFPGKIVVFSSELSPAVADLYRAHGVDRIIAKPVFPSDLRRTLAELFPAPSPAG